MAEDGGILFSTEVLVNTAPSKSVSWIVRSTASEHKDEDFNISFIEELRDAVLKLPARVSLPRFVSPSSLPRYYLIVLSAERNIVEIVGVRGDSTPTKWSYRLGYWHPACQLKIARALQVLLKRRSCYQVAPRNT
jgi:hypothetical protein